MFSKKYSSHINKSYDISQKRRLKKYEEPDISGEHGTRHGRKPAGHHGVDLRPAIKYIFGLAFVILIGQK